MIDDNKIRVAIDVAKRAIEDSKKEKHAKGIAKRIVEACVRNEKEVDVPVVILGLFMALFAIMDAAKLLTDKGEENSGKKTTKKDNMLN